MDIETIYRLYFRDVCLFLQGLTRSEALAEELTQETFLRMGVDELSMNAKSILPVRKIIRSVDLSKPSEKA